MKLGFIGLGAMGLPMAVNLVNKSGCEVYGFDISPQRCQEFEAAGGSAAEDAGFVYTNCGVVFLSMPTNQLLEQCVGEAMAADHPPRVLVDLGSTDPGIIRRLSGEAEHCGVSLIDSPVSGGEAGAENGALAIMCGGRKETFEQVRPLLETIGATVVYMGPSGNGSVAKLANNMIVGCNIASTAEAFAFAVKAGLNPTDLFHAIHKGGAASAILELKAPKMIQGDYSPSARVAVHQKDLKNAKKTADEIGMDIPLSNLVLEYMNRLEAMGKSDEDHSAIAQIYERDAGILIRDREQKNL